VPVNLPYEGKSTKYQWLDALRDGDHGMTPAEGYLLSELVRMSSERWREIDYQRKVLANHDLAHRGVFAAWPSTDTLAQRLGVKRRYLQELSKRLQARGYLTVMKNAGGTGERARADRPNLWVIDARTVPVVPRGALQDTPQCTVVRDGVHSSAQRGALQDTQIVSEESMNTNSLNVAVNGQREMASVKADELPEQMTLELTSAIRSICPQDDLRTAQSNARSLASLGATPDLVRQFPSWWANSGKTYTYGSAAIVKWWTAFAAAHSTDAGQPTASSATRPLCENQECVDGWIPQMDTAMSDPCPTCRPNWRTQANQTAPAVTTRPGSSDGLAGVKAALRQARMKQPTTV